MSLTGRHPSYEDLCDRARARIREIEPRELLELDGVLILDVREQVETSSGVLPDSRLVPRGQLERL